MAAKIRVETVRTMSKVGTRRARFLARVGTAREVIDGDDGGETIEVTKNDRWWKAAESELD